MEGSGLKAGLKREEEIQSYPVALSDCLQFGVAHLQRERQRVPCYKVCKPWPGCTRESLAGDGLTQTTSKASPSPQMHCMVLGSGKGGGDRWAELEFRGR